MGRIARWFAKLLEKWKSRRRRAPRRKKRLRLGVGFLEDRSTPTVNALTFAAVTPAMHARDAVLVSGVVADSHANAVLGFNLTADFRVVDAQGHVIKTGVVTFKPAQTGNASFSQTIALPGVSPSSRETIVITARDQDDINAGRNVSARTDIVVDAPSGNAVSIGSQSAGGNFQAQLQGNATVTKTAQGALSVAGAGTYGVFTTSDLGALSAVGKGSLSFRSDPVGNIALQLGGKTNFALTGGLSGGLRGNMQGQFVVNRGVDQSIAVRAQGKFTPQPGGPLGNVTGGGTGLITLRSNGQGHFALGATGHVAVKGDIHTQGPAQGGLALV